ncbi:MAG TPA: hypothetical protein VNG69_11190 [Casimicrobiaceae bacterium]|nr:hypothetical protein [Casimicrobiaceae bacterium]
MSQRQATNERGSALLFVLVMLLLLAWFGLSGMRLSSQHLQIVGNTQVKQHATAAAQRAIEQTISSNQFALDPAAVAAAPIDADIDGDGRSDYQAVLDPRPRCTRVRPIKTSELDVALVPDRVCFMSSDSGGTHVIDRPLVPVATGDSLCAASEWDIAARVDDPRSGARVRVHQGVGIRVAKFDAANYCK